MKISGFTFVRNAVKFDYPVKESIVSILPVVDEYIVNVGDCDDGTRELIESVGSPKIKIIDSVWDDALTKDGKIFAQQTNIALSHCTGDWAFYLQADEMVHEKDLPALVRFMEEKLAHKNVLGFMFWYLHFFGDYWSVNPWGYHKEIRIIRNNGSVESGGDATGFYCTSDGLHLKDRRAPEGRVIFTGVNMYHYSYVKNPKTLAEKLKAQVSKHIGDAPKESMRKSFRIQGLTEEQHKVFFQMSEFPFEKYDIMKNFNGSHPNVMQGRIKNFPRLKRFRSRWLHLNFYKEVLKHGFKG